MHYRGPDANPPLRFLKWQFEISQKQQPRRRSRGPPRHSAESCSSWSPKIGISALIGCLSLVLRAQLGSKSSSLPGYAHMVTGSGKKALPSIRSLGVDAVTGSLAPTVRYPKSPSFIAPNDPILFTISLSNRSCLAGSHDASRSEHRPTLQLWSMRSLGSAPPFHTRA